MTPPPGELWCVPTDADALALATTLAGATGWGVPTWEAARAPRAGVPVAVLVTPAFKDCVEGQAAPRALADAYQALVAPGSDEAAPLVPVWVAGAWPLVAPDDLVNAAPYVLIGPDPAELAALIHTLRALSGGPQATRAP